MKIMPLAQPVFGVMVQARACIQQPVAHVYGPHSESYNRSRLQRKMRSRRPAKTRCPHHCNSRRIKAGQMPQTQGRKRGSGRAYSLAALRGAI